MTYAGVELKFATLGRRPSGDYRGSHWCEDSDGGFHACDSYAIRVDEQNWSRDKNALEYYLKFSIDESSDRYMVMISCHP